MKKENNTTLNDKDLFNTLEEYGKKLDKEIEEMCKETYEKW